MRLVIPLVLILLGAGGLFVAYHSQKPETTIGIEEQAPVAELPQADSGVQSADAESYIRAHISELSPLEEQLGGTFFVTKIEVHEGAGFVEYEDGHNAYVADFTYSSGTDGIAVDSFVIRD